METLEFPEIRDAAPVRSDVAIAATQAIDLAKLDLTDVALAQFGDWRGDVAKTRAKLTGVVWHPETPKGLAELRDVRHKMTRQPRYEGTRIAKALKSKLAQVSKAIGAEDDAQCKAWEELEAPLTKLIDEREAQIEAERAERERIESERKQRHADAIAKIASYATLAQGLPLDRVEGGLAYVRAIDVSAEVFEEFAERAAEQKQVTIERLEKLIADIKAQAAAEAQRIEIERIAAAQRAEADRLAAERAELERQRAELEIERVRAAAARAEADALAEERRELEAAQRRAAAPAPAAGDDKAPTEPGAGKVDTPALEREATQLMTRPEEVGGQVDGCRAPEGQPVLCSGQHPQDHTSQPASPSIAPATAAVETDEADDSGPSPVEAAAPPAEAHPSAAPAMSHSDILAQALELTQYAAGAFAGRFPSHPKPGPDWWAGLRARIEHLQPMLAAAREQR